MQELVRRYQTPYLLQMLERHPVVILQGARQTGKTTLCRTPDIGRGRTYLSLDNLQTREIAEQDPAALLIGREKLTLDEVQRRPELLLAVKEEVDRERTAGRFLITGSAHLLMMRNISDSLAGRAVYFFLPGLIWAEIEGKPFGGFLDSCWTCRTLQELLSAPAAERTEPGRDLAAAVFAGGYPVPALSEDLAYRAQWFDGYIQTYLERDLQELSSIDRLVDFRRIMRLSAARNGSLQNTAALASDAGVAQSTVWRYLNLLELSFQILRIPAFTANRGKRLVRAPKIYGSDTGLAAHLAGYFSAEELSAGLGWGFWLENWMAVHLAAYAAVRAPGIGIYHWRTSNGKEVDFVLERGKRLVPIEVKATPRPLPRQAQGLEAFLDLHPEASIGILVCRCEQPVVLSSRVVALPFEHLLLQ